MASGASSIPTTDVLILSVIPPELTAIRRAFGVSNSSRRKHEDGSVYFFGTIRSEIANRDYALALGCIGRAGNPHAAVAAMAAIQDLSPRAVLLVGIAGGIRDKTRIGQVVLSEGVFGYEPAALKRGKTKVGATRAAVEPRPSFTEVPHTINQDVQVWMAEEKATRAARLETRFRTIDGEFPKAPKGKRKEYADHVCREINAESAVLASGEKLFRDALKLYALRRQHGKIEAVEMEAIGVVEACKRQCVPWLVVRGISDFGDDLKDDAFHRFASDVAACVAADFVQHGLDLGESRPGQSSNSSKTELDVESYVSRIRKELASWPGPPAPRFLFGSAQERVIVTANATPLSLAPKDGELFFVGGWSGRGKSTVLRILAGRALAESPRRVPLFVRPTDRSSLTSLVAKALDHEGDTTTTVRGWLKQTPTLIIADDWHSLSADDRKHFEGLTAARHEFPMAVVIAGAESVSAPRVPAVGYLRLVAYDESERDGITRVALQQPAHFDILAQLPDGLRELLREPVLLAKFIALVKPLPRNASLPRDIPSLFRQLLEASLASRHESAARRANEVTCVCSRLAREPAPYDLPKIAAALATCAVNESPAEFALELHAASIWAPTASGLHEFSHSIWRDYFKAVGNVNSGIWTNALAITSWVSTADLVDLRGLLPFATGLVDDAELQSVLFDCLLKRDVSLYARALRTRATTTVSSIDALRSLRWGYLAMVDSLVPTLKPLLEPWRYGDGEEKRRNERVVLVGRVSDWDVSFYFGFATEDVEDVVIADERPLQSSSARPTHAAANGWSMHGHTTGADRLRRDSGRLLGARLLFEQLEKIVKERGLPLIGWLARERFISYVSKLGFSGQFEMVEWHRKTVASLVRWAERGGKWKQQIDGWGISGGVIYVAEFLALGKTLVQKGFGNTAIKDLGLPGPDLKLGEGGDFSRYYSAQQKVRRATELYRAVAETYPQLCDELFPGLTGRFFRAQFPSRAVVELHEDDNSASVYWEPVGDDNVTPVVSIAKQRRSRREWQDIAGRVRLACDRLGRPSDHFTVRTQIREWAPYDDVVTDSIGDLLRDDLKRVNLWLDSAT